MNNYRIMCMYEYAVRYRSHLGLQPVSPPRAENELLWSAGWGDNYFSNTILTTVFYGNKKRIASFYPNAQSTGVYSLDYIQMRLDAVRINYPVNNLWKPL